MSSQPKPNSPASFASDPAKFTGRLTFEDESVNRSPFQRDRDRIIHSTAFRRLQYKTQVFVYHEGDHFRTRLTHSLEVAQVARSIARTLGLNEDLTEALALAHDLGHTPFGHAGERELNACMSQFGGFDHNAQTLRIVTRLERKYAAFDGLNLTRETLDGLIKHNGPLTDAQGDPVGRYREHGLPAALTDFAVANGFSLETLATAEAQVAAIADDIAYNAHDIDDGLRAGLFDVIDLGDLPLAGEALGEVVAAWPNLERSRLIHEMVRRVMHAMITDVGQETRRRIAAMKISSLEDVQRADRPVVAMSAQLQEKNRVLQAFLDRRMYRHAKVSSIMARARKVVRDLFDAYMDDPAQMPDDWRDNAFTDDQSLFAHQVCDFIAGMTDRYALARHKALFDLDPLFR